ncbi:MAG: family 43 glycosylhydrolase [Pontiellaceae bacterium]|nr:family 43 glycosylhydrolase [Pontiellaceae bacterium]MBN2784802.1 family 43 glycosylhydrolase [Pontiellaceae bacterium]
MEPQNACTIHPGIVDFNGKTYLFYHNGDLPGGGGFHRSVCVNELQFEANGTVKKVTATKEGAPQNGVLDPYKTVEAETIGWESGIETEKCSDENGGMNIFDIDNGDYIKVKGVDFGAGASMFGARVASASKGGKIELRLGSVDGTLIGTCTVKNTGGDQQWENVSCKVDGAAGVHDLYLVFKGGDGDLFNFNWWRFRKEQHGNPIFRDAFTADPAPLVVGDTLYVYVGHDEAEDGGPYFNITEWLCYSTTDMEHWTAHGAVLKPTDFKWATGEAWASQVVEKDGQFFYYTTAQHGDPNCKAIGVAVADRPTGPFRDARGTALIIDSDTPNKRGWNDIDPTVLIDDDGVAWLSWGNGTCFLARLNSNMIEIDGEIMDITPESYVEGPWLHKRDHLYYLTYAGFSGGSENIRYATAEKITGPWSDRGELTGNARNSFTIHPGIIEFNGQWYLFYHNATLTLDGQEGATGRRSVCVERLYYNADGTMKPVEQTVDGITSGF